MATACILPGSPAYGLAVLPDGDRKLLAVEHTSGEFSVELEATVADGWLEVAALLRTARRLFEGRVLVPHAVWDGRRPTAVAAE